MSALLVTPTHTIMNPEETTPFFNPNVDIDITRHRLPHWQQGNVWIFATFRLNDSLPTVLLAQWEKERDDWLSQHPRPWDWKTEAEYNERFPRRFEYWLDQGRGSCVLKDPAIAKIVADALRHFDGERYELAAFVVMPNHVHVLFRPLGNHRLPAIMKAWKGFTAREINRRIGESGRLWQPDYRDRLIRNERHFYAAMEYIRDNPY